MKKQIYHIAFILIFLGVATLVLALSQKNSAEQDTGENLAVPFTPQAPEGDWSEPWQNACEETSIIMVDNFYEGSSLTKEEARAEILRIFREKNEKYGPSLDESMEFVAQIINEANLSWKATVIENPALEQIKGELNDKHPVIAPVYAPQLKSAAYGPLGPDYHVFVISGYDDLKQQFIVQDPGTKKGENFRFGYEELLAAIHDYFPEDIRAGRKAVIFTDLD